MAVYYRFSALISIDQNKPKFVLGPSLVLPGCLGIKTETYYIEEKKYSLTFFGIWIKGAMSPVAHALASENKLEKDGPSFSSSVGDFGRLFLAVEISAIVR